MILMTWNMQGAGTMGKPSAKWEKLADWLIHQPKLTRPGLVAVQECGVVPEKLPGKVALVREFAPGGWPVMVYRWTAVDQSGLNSRDYYVSYAELDTGANRVNLAVVSEAEPEDAATTFAEKRPAIGVSIGGIWFFSIHASAAFGWDVEDLLANIWTTVSCGPWIALGDYNKQPGYILWKGEALSQPTRECGLGSISTPDYTHPRVPEQGSKLLILDYIVQTKHVGIAVAHREDMGLSDHYAVVFA
ncbi:MAG: hypothetical protein Q8N54_06580 [Sulfurimicrobium sp.]|jgi:endonuclease/exonuclease/phosphatase family metal-dependent hydrolase|nr:hypothetical protein [Sulfurimicrobium sp.]MDO9191012.1 hypothetical protein [Sulfurimicrobium sp.]MDP1704544.1 hypothetical protein [Sulfurimicrobium sp.]MDP2197773.1 hypothetical protein [Sulfurimicrobium sp.]MDP2962409.1 hypothetical protein [Sulfurimicrobium sp.]